MLGNRMIIWFGPRKLKGIIPCTRNCWIRFNGPEPDSLVIFGLESIPQPVIPSEIRTRQLLQEIGTHR